MTYGTAKIIEHDMEPWQLQESVDCAVYALHHFQDEQEVAEFMKKEFDLKYEPSWHVIVGQSFGAYLGHDIRKCAYFSIGCLFFVIFKSPDTEVPYIQADEGQEEEEKSSEKEDEKGDEGDEGAGEVAGGLAEDTPEHEGVAEGEPEGETTDEQADVED